MATQFLFYFILYPLSILPLKVLYLLFFPFYLLITYVFKYRKSVTYENLTCSFPEKDLKTIHIIYKRFQNHLTQIAAEMLKMLTISRKELKKRYYCSNPELVNSYFKEGKSVLLVSGHYNNWEWMVLALDSMFLHHGIGVGKANSNKDFETLINRARTRYGTEVVFADHVRETFEQYLQSQTPCAYMMLSDQSPNNLKKAYYTTFLNQDSAMIYGAEYFARKYDFPVFYYQVIKDKPGYYHVELELITDKPLETVYGEITEKYVQLLEKTIKNKPQYWLWSHRRWKNRGKPRPILET
ncbi:MAG: lysophospholipid acyltransferase family protein [Bacteroidales bacterium]|nr:lysophospholipid acyltransferase family protein [Bacteroidales bacterium]